MKRIALIITIAAMWAVGARGDSLVYNVEWHWGLMNMHVGHAYVNIDCQDGQVEGTMCGTSIPIEGKIMSVSDTLTARVSLAQADIDFINAVYRKRKTGDPYFGYRSINGEGNLNASPETMQTVNTTALLIGFYYYAQTLDFASMSAGEIFRLPINYGDEQGHLDVTYGGCNGNAYDMTLVYYIPGIPQYNIECQVDVDSRVPILFASALPIGRVQMTLE